MNKNNFTEEDISELRNNKYVKSVSKNSISFTKEFKEYFICKNQTGKEPHRIFVECGINPYVLGYARIIAFAMRIRKKYKNNKSLEDERGRKSKGKIKTNENKGMTDKEKIEYLEHENLVLKAENNLLKKWNFQ